MHTYSTLHISLIKVRIWWLFTMSNETSTSSSSWSYQPTPSHGITWRAYRSHAPFLLWIQRRKRGIRKALHFNQPTPHGVVHFYEIWQYRKNELSCQHEPHELYFSSSNVNTLLLLDVYIILVDFKHHYKNHARPKIYKNFIIFKN